jgi:uncharacterized protein YlxW (UPF0749 family)
MTAEHVAAWSGVGLLLLTIIGGVIGYILHQNDKAAEAENENRDREFARLDAGLKAAWAQIDKLKDERATYSTRSDNEKLRLEFKADIRELGDRMVLELRQLREDFKAVVGQIKQAS